MRRLRMLAIAVCLTVGGPSAELMGAYDGVSIRIGGKANPVEKNAAALLAERLSAAKTFSVRIEDEKKAQSPQEKELLILLGIPEHHAELAREMQTCKLAPLTDLDPGPEGFLLHMPTMHKLLAAGIDSRGVVYAVGEILRLGYPSVHGTFNLFPPPDVRKAPAFEIRGTQYGQSSVALTKAKVRPWTDLEAERKIADYALAGANTIQVAENVSQDDPVYQYIRGLGLKTLIHCGPNTGEGPAEWEAIESIGRTNYLCPSVPEARQALLDKAEAVFSHSPDFDYVRFPGGDGGGCECDKCDPYGLTFIRLCEDLSAIVHKYHPETEIFVTNQKFDNADDLAIFKYLQEKPRPWLRAFCYGPGSDAMSWQPGHRQTHRMDLFRYPGFGPNSRYLHEILHQLPPEQDLAFFNEITHWRYSQNGYAQAYPRPDIEGNHPPRWGHFAYERIPDRYLTQVYDRLTFFAWPRYLHKAFGETVRYGIGDVTHSSGTHDHFNQWMWQRMLWDPQRSAEDLVNEYACTWFGPEAEAVMAEAIFLMEQYLQDDPKRPLPQKDEVDRFYDLVKEAGTLMPAHLRDTSWLWREYMEKGCVDKRTKLAVTQQMEVQKRIEERIAQALKSGENLDAAIDTALPWLTETGETEAMRALREEAERLGEESNTLYGVRSDGIFSLDHDFIGLGWTKRQLERAKTVSGDEKTEMLLLIANYENPGPGGFYDNCGTYESAPHLVNGYPYDFGQPIVPEMMDEGNRYSQRTMGYTQQEQQGVTFHYEDLDPAAQYRVRMTLVRPKYQARYAQRMNQHSESIYADDTLLAKDVEVPERMSDFFTWDIPMEATKDGVLTLRLEKAPDVASGDRVNIEQWRNSGGWGTIVSEVWLMKQKP